MKQHILFALTALTTVACAAPDTDLETAFCDGLAAPAARTVAASDTPADAADVTDASRVDIELLEGDGQFSGFVSYRPDEAGSFAFGLTANVDLIVRDEAGNEVPIDVTVEGAACAELAVRHSVMMDLQTYTLEIGPTDQPSIGLIAEESDDDQ